jgi:hypothetical protein
MKPMLIVAITAAVTFYAGTLQAADHSRDTAPATPAADKSVSGSPGMEALRPEKGAPRVDREKLSPMHREIYDAVESERAQIQALSRRFAQTDLAADRLTIQKEIESIKKGGQLTVLEIQLRYARAGKHDEAVRQLEKAIDALKNPKLPQGSGPTLLEQAQQSTNR